MLNSGDIGWVLGSTAMVLLMTPAVALFYGGLVPARNVINTMNMSFICLGIIPITWCLLGYSLAFAVGNGFIGGTAYFLLQNVSFMQNFDGLGISTLDQMIFQMMFAVVTPALIAGAMVGRIKFKPYVLFLAIWSIVIYAPIAHWVWGPGGWLTNLGAIDFAGGTVVHINAGMAALAAILVLGQRGTKSRVKGELPHNVPLVILGSSLLWFGWYGFNAGSALAANGLATLAFTNTTVATAAAVMAWLFMSWFRGDHATAVGSAIAVVIGLVAITPAAGYVAPMGAIAIGGISAVICNLATYYKKILLPMIDDPLDVFICHGISGITGSILTGVFATLSANPQGANGLLYGNPKLLLLQLIAVGSVALMSGLGTALILYIMKKTLSTRWTEEEEEKGIDALEHGQGAYQEMEEMIDELTKSKNAITMVNQRLMDEIRQREEAQQSLNISNQQLVVASRRAGMAEIATSVLHNIGNVLNSVNVTANLVMEKVTQSKMLNLKKLAALLEEHKNDMANFVTTTPQGQQIPNYVTQLAECWREESKELMENFNALTKNIQHIKEIVAMQQGLSGTISVFEMVDIESVINDAIQLNDSSALRKNVSINQDLIFKDGIKTDRVKVLQILVNLIKNSLESLQESGVENKTIIIKSARHNSHNNFIIIEVIDNGLGIRPEDLEKMFMHGFTTKKSGHGYGLHTSILAAKELGGNLTAESAGLGKGVKFSLILPIIPKRRKEDKHET